MDMVRQPHVRAARRLALRREHVERKVLELHKTDSEVLATNKHVKTTPAKNLLPEDDGDLHRPIKVPGPDPQELSAHQGEPWREQGVGMVEVRKLPGYRADPEAHTRQNVRVELSPGVPEAIVHDTGSQEGAQEKQGPYRDELDDALAENPRCLPTRSIGSGRLGSTSFPSWPR